MGPQASILMTVYNGARTIATALHSALSQAYSSEYEVVVVDDGSTDATSEILASFAPHYSNLRIISPGRVGRSRALNIGLSACRAPYVAINDCDDFSYPNRLQLQVEYLESHSDVVLVAGWAEIVDDSGTVIGDRRLRNNDRVLRRRLALGNPFIHSTVTIRKEALERVGGFDEARRAAIDYDAIERLARIGRLACVERFIVRHCRGEQQYFRAQLDPSIRWRSAAQVALRSSLNHAWWLSPVATVILACTYMPIPRKLLTTLHRLHGSVVSRS